MVAAWLLLASRYRRREAVRISQATAEQTLGIAQMSAAVDQLDQMTQQNAALVEESAAAAESLREQADRMKEAVAVFQVADHHHRV